MLGWLCFIFLRCTDHIGKSNLGYSDDLSLKPLLMRQWPKHSNLQSCHQSWPSSTSSSNSSLSPESPSYIISIFYKRLPFNFLPPQLFPRIKSHHCINFHVAPSVIIIIHRAHQDHNYYQNHDEGNQCFTSNWPHCKRHHDQNEYTQDHNFNQNPQ